MRAFVKKSSENIQKIPKNALPMRRQYGFWMKLYSFQPEFAVPDAHNLSFFRFGAYLET